MMRFDLTDVAISLLLILAVPLLIGIMGGLIITGYHWGTIWA